jgi:hypothetical protein
VTPRVDPETELLELGVLAPMVIPSLTRLPDGRLVVGCRYRCTLAPTAGVADTIRALVAHSEVRP